jgi:hypothetical protein
MEGICELCGKLKRLNKHHLKYDPEIKVFLCFSCHSTVHKFAKLKPSKQRLLLSWVEQFGKFWLPGHIQYRSTESYRQESIERAKRRAIKKKKEIANYQKDYYENNKEELNKYHRKYKKTKKGKQHIENWNKSEKAKKYKHDWYKRKKNESTKSI